jgi:hypothetical protein
MAVHTTTVRRRAWPFRWPHGPSLECPNRSRRNEPTLPLAVPFSPLLGGNIFAQMVQPSTARLFENPYVFPPICLIAQVLEFLTSLYLSFTMVVSDVLPRRHWWPVLYATSKTRALLAPAVSVGALWVPSKEGYCDNWSLPWDLWVFRVSPLRTGFCTLLGCGAAHSIT